MQTATMKNAQKSNDALWFSVYAAGSVLTILCFAVDGLMSSMPIALRVLASLLMVATAFCWTIQVIFVVWKVFDKWPAVSALSIVAATLAGVLYYCIKLI